MKQYLTVELTTGFFSGNLDSKKLEELLNKHARLGWSLRSHLKETRRMMFFSSRECHVVIFERDVASASTSSGAPVGYND